MRINLKLTQRRQVGRLRGKKGAPSLFENCPLKSRRHENTSQLLGGALYFGACPFSPWSPSDAINVPRQVKTSLIFSCKGQGHPTTAFCKISVRRSKNCLEISIPWGWLRISRWPFRSCTIFEAYLHMVFTVTSSNCKVKIARFNEFLFTLGWR